jgi:serine/threonine protein kinase
MTIKVFLCHHENDARYCDELAKHLKLAERNQQVELWSRRQLRAGENVRRVVDEKLEQAGLILVLMSADLLACDYCWGVEISAGLQRHRAGRARLVPVILRACDWRPCFPDLQQVPATGVPLVTDAAKIDDARFLEAASEILNVVRAFESEAASNVTRVTAMVDIVAELDRLERQSFSSSEATTGLLRLSAGLRYLEPPLEAARFDDDLSTRAIPENALAPMRRVYSEGYSGAPGETHPPTSSADLQRADDGKPAVDVLHRARPSMAPGDFINSTVRLVSRLGAGGMGSVWRAENLRLHTQIAVKMLLPQHLAHAESRQRFKQEAYVLARIQSPHVVQVLDYGETDAGEPYILLELLEGETLGSRLRALGPLPVPDVVQIVNQVASALGKAHSLGIVHRDLKPENLFLIRVGGELFVKVIDFGIAKLPQTDLDKVITRQGQVLGTRNYMSPEALVDSRDVDHRADVWALAAVAYEALTGQRPFQAKSFLGVALATHAGVFARPTALQPGLPEAVDAWAERALKRDPAQRFGTVREAADAFRDAVMTASQGTTPPSVAQAPPVAPPSPPLANLLGQQPRLPPVVRVVQDDTHRVDPTVVSGKRDAQGELALVHREGKLEGRREGHSAGRAEEAARAVLTVLRVRGVPVTDAVRERILAEKDPDRLERWLERAAIAASVEQAFDEAGNG